MKVKAIYQSIDVLTSAVTAGSRNELRLKGEEGEEGEELSHELLLHIEGSQRSSSSPAG